jgi:uncharacterized protein YkwD
MRMLRRRVAIVVIGSATLILAPPAWAACPGADAQPEQISVTDYAVALLCEVNEERSAYGRPPLVLQGNLIRAAVAHSADMVAQQYFSHTSPDGEMYADRLVAAGFIPSSNRWRAGENLAAGDAAEATPAAIAAAWMNSAEHRVNLLDSGYTMAGIGVSRGYPIPGYDQANALTITLDLGWRRRSRSERMAASP